MVIYKVTGNCGNKGFTMVELIVVCAVVAILAGIAIPLYTSYVDKARLTLSVTTLADLRRVFDLYTVDNHGYPKKIDFTNFTDQNGTAIADSTKTAQFNDKTKIYSFDSYSSTTISYTLIAKGADSNHTIITVTPSNIKY